MYAGIHTNIQWKPGDITSWDLFPYAIWEIDDFTLCASYFFTTKLGSGHLLTDLPLHRMLHHFEASKKYSCKISAWINIDTSRFTKQSDVKILEKRPAKCIKLPSSNLTHCFSSAAACPSAWKPSNRKFPEEHRPTSARFGPQKPR